MKKKEVLEVIKLIFMHYDNRPIRFERLLYVLYLVELDYYEINNIGLFDLEWNANASDLNSFELHKFIEDEPIFTITSIEDINEDSIEMVFLNKMFMAVEINDFDTRLNVITSILKFLFLNLFELKEKVFESDEYKENLFSNFVIGLDKNYINN